LAIDVAPQRKISVTPGFCHISATVSVRRMNETGRIAGLGSVRRTGTAPYRA